MHAAVGKSGSSVSLMVLHLPPRRHARHSASSVSGPPECPLGAGAGAGDAVPRLRQQQQSPTTFHCHCPVCKCISVFASFSMHGIIRNSFHALEIRQLLLRPSHCLSLKYDNQQTTSLWKLFIPCRYAGECYRRMTLTKRIGV